MRFPVNSLYEISEKGKEPVYIEVITSPSEFNKIRVRNIKNGEEDYLIKYLKTDAEISHIPDPEIRNDNKA
jgi:hypothetical protein